MAGTQHKGSAGENAALLDTFREQWLVELSESSKKERLTSERFATVKETSGDSIQRSRNTNPQQAASQKEVARKLRSVGQESLTEHQLAVLNLMMIL